MCLIRSASKPVASSMDISRASEQAYAHCWCTPATEPTYLFLKLFYKLMKQYTAVEHGGQVQAGMGASQLHEQATKRNIVIRVTAAGQQRIVVIRIYRAGWAEEFGTVGVCAGVLAVSSVLVDLHRLPATELSSGWAVTQFVSVPRMRSGTV